MSVALRCRRYSLAGYLMGIVTMAWGGCAAQTNAPLNLPQTLSQKSAKSEPAMPPAGPIKVVVDGTAMALRRPESDVKGREKFVLKFEEMLDQERTAAANMLVHRHPDYALATLQQAVPPLPKYMMPLAAAYDGMCGTAAAEGWQSVVSQAATPAVQYYCQRRAQWMAMLGSGKFAETERLDLVAAAQQTGHRPLVADAWHQTGVGLLLREKPAEAVTAFHQAANTAQPHLPAQAAEAMLMNSEARRRAGDSDGAILCWGEAVQMAAKMLTLSPPIADPTLWDRATYLQPVGVKWPVEVSFHFERLASGPAQAVRTELIQQLGTSQTAPGSLPPAAWIYAAMGSWQQDRGDAQQALIHLKKAESCVTGPATDWLRIAQSRSLLALGQPGPATTVLIPLAGRKDQELSTLAALSQLGLMRVQQGTLPQGIQMLRRALDEHPEQQWPGRGSVEADYALALLMVGDTQHGLDRLHQTQQRFTAEGELELLAKSLWNEKQYLNHLGDKTADLSGVQYKLDSLRL